MKAWETERPRLSSPLILIGTSGWLYPEWKGKFYPCDLAAKKMLPYYAGHFPTTESNYTFRTIPSVKTLSNWSVETPANFWFSLKAPQEITHFKKLRGCGDVLTRFWEAALNLKEKLGVVLFQLPPFLKRDVAALNDFLAVLPHSMKCAFEFRHASWFAEDVSASLRAKIAALCIADSEKLKTPVVATADFSYFRLRDEGYEKKDIARWAELIAEQNRKAKNIYVYFKHEESGSGPQFARQLMENLDIEISAPEPSAGSL